MGTQLMDIHPLTEMELRGQFDARYLAFLETIVQLRPRLHRYCSRMTGSVLDGEDVVQEALFQAYRKLDTFDDDRPLEPWLFRIAHNRCIDFLRHRGARAQAEATAAADDPTAFVPAEAFGRELGRAVEHLVLALPPKERACVLLKDVFDYSLEEIAGLVDSSVGGVKAALHRGRNKLAELPKTSRPSQATDADTARLLELYAERFNRRDWDGVRELIAADARLRVADRFDGRLGDSPYFGRYERWPFDWQMTTGEVDGEAVIVMLRKQGDAWTPGGLIRLDVTGRHVHRVTDYLHSPWVMAAAASLTVAGPTN